MTEPAVNMPLLLEQISNVVQRQDALTTQLERLTNTLTSNYVSKETYEANRQADNRRFVELEKDNDNQAAFRRQVVAGFVVGFLLVLVNLVGVVNYAIGR